MAKTRTIVNVPVPASVRARLSRAAKAEDRSMAAVARRAILAELDRVEGKAA